MVSSSKLGPVRPFLTIEFNLNKRLKPVLRQLRHAVGHWIRGGRRVTRVDGKVGFIDIRIHVYGNGEGHGNGITIRIRDSDLYVIAFQKLSTEKWFMFSNKDILNCHVPGGKRLHIDSSYGEMLGNGMFENLPAISYDTLVAAIETLDRNNSEKNWGSALAVLCVCFSEATRFRKLGTVLDKCLKDRRSHKLTDDEVNCIKNWACLTKELVECIHFNRALNEEPPLPKSSGNEDDESDGSGSEVDVDGGDDEKVFTYPDVDNLRGILAVLLGTVVESVDIDNGITTGGKDKGKKDKGKMDKGKMEKGKMAKGKKAKGKKAS